jgi:cytochrome c oxidase subunit 1
MVMGVSPVLAVFGGIYHWFPKISGRMFNETLGKLHFWITFLGAYAIFFPMHYLGILGMPRRYYAYDNYAFIPPSAQVMNEFITIAALVVGVAQLFFLFNMAYSTFRGRAAGGNPWRAASLEWYTPETPPTHGNWGPHLPVAYRGAYEYGRPGPGSDYLPQSTGPDEGGPDAPSGAPAGPGRVQPAVGGASA